MSLLSEFINKIYTSRRNRKIEINLQINVVPDSNKQSNSEVKNNNGTVGNNVYGGSLNDTEMINNFLKLLAYKDTLIEKLLRDNEKTTINI